MPPYKVIDADGKSCKTGTRQDCREWIDSRPPSEAMRYRIVDLFYKSK